MWSELRIALAVEGQRSGSVARHRAGGDQHVTRVDAASCRPRPRPRRVRGPSSRPRPCSRLDLVLLEQRLDALGVLAHHLPLVLLRLAMSSLGSPHGDAEARAPWRASSSRSAVWSSALVGMQPRCRQVPPSEGSFSTTVTVRPSWRGADAGDVAAGSAADDDEIARFGHGAIVSRHRSADPRCRCAPRYEGDRLPFAADDLHAARPARPPPHRGRRPWRLPGRRAARHRGAPSRASDPHPDRRLGRGINVACLAASRAGLRHGTETLNELWCSIEPESVFRADPLSLFRGALRWVARLGSGGAPTRAAHAWAGRHLPALGAAAPRARRHAQRRDPGHRGEPRKRQSPGGRARHHRLVDGTHDLLGAGPRHRVVGAPTAKRPGDATQRRSRDGVGGAAAPLPGGEARRLVAR